MIKKGRHLIKSHMTLTFNFSGIRVIDSGLSSVDWELSIDLVATAKPGKSRDDAEYSASVAYQKIYFWLDTNLPNIVVVDVNNEADMYIANLSSNLMLFCPGLASDDLIIQLLHSKISVLAGENLVVGEMRLGASDTTLQYTFDCLPGEHELPNKVSNYYTECITRDEIPWWARDDGFCFEFVRPAETEVSDEELFRDIVDPLDEFRKWIDENSEVHIGMPKEPAKIVQVERWKPKTV